MNLRKKVIWTSILIFILLLCIIRGVLAEEIQTGTYYKIDYKNKIISRVEPKTEVTDFITNLNTSASDIKIYKDKTKEQEVLQGEITTGMVLENTKTSDVYEISVIGDFNGDGKTTQLDLSYIIRKIVGIEELEKVKLESADLTGDGKVDQRDITKCIKYIVYGELDLDKEYIVVPDAGVEAGAITFEEPIWSEGKASINITTNTYYQVEYQVNSVAGTWIKENTAVDLQNNDIVYVRLTDGMHTGNYTSITILDTKEPEITLTLNSTTSTITVEAIAEDKETGLADDVTYKFSIKEESGPDTSYVEKQDTTESVCEITGLKQDTSYTIKVEVQDINGNVGTKLENERTKKLPDASNVEGAITFGNITWVNGKANIQITTNTEFQIEYQINSTEGTWTSAGEGINTVTLQNLQHEDIVYARLYDGTNSGNYASYNIADTEKPEITVVLTSTTSTIRAEVIAEDSETGIASDAKYKFSIKEEEMPDTYYIEKQETTSKICEMTGLKQNTSYNIKVEVQDIVGNTKEQVETITTKTMPDASNEEGAITFSNAIWANKNANVQISTDTQYQIEYQVNGITGLWTRVEQGIDAVTVGNLLHGDVIYARLFDGTNVGNYASYNVLDTQKPLVTLTLTSTTSTIRAEVQAQDAQSGLADDVKYKFSIKESFQDDDVYMEKQNTTLNVCEFSELKDNTSYTIKVELEDIAGNCEYDVATIQTGKLTQLTQANITFAYTPNGWTNENVIVAATLRRITLKTGEKMQISTNGIDWTDGSSKVFSSNGNLYVRITDGTNVSSTAVGKVDNIDKHAPTVSITNVSTTLDGIMVTVEAEDIGNSGIKSFTCIAQDINGNKIEEAANQTATSILMTEMEHGNSYYVYVRAYDNAGNYSDTASVKVDY